MAIPNGAELLIIVGVAVLLFVPKKIPELAKGLGQGIRGFKNELNGTSEEKAPTDSPKPAQAAASTDTSKETQSSIESLKQSSTAVQENHSTTEVKINHTS